MTPARELVRLSGVGGRIASDRRVHPGFALRAVHFILNDVTISPNKVQTGSLDARSRPGHRGRSRAEVDPRDPYHDRVANALEMVVGVKAVTPCWDVC